MIKIESEHPHHLRIKVDDYLLDLFATYNIFDKRNSDPGSRNRWAPGNILSIPRNWSVEEHCTFGQGGNLCNIGSFSETMSQFPMNATIGRYCSISTDVKFLAFRHPMDAAIMSSASFNQDREFVKSYKSSLAAKGVDFEFKRTSTPQPQNAPITVGHDVWIGANVRLRGGIEIGNGAIIASDSVVTKNIPPFAVAGGNPAKIIKFRFPGETIELLQESKWWKYELYELHKFEIQNPLRFAESVIANKDNLAIYKPRVLSIKDYL